MPRPPRYDQPIDYNPCLECKLCVAACPVGAIAPDGHFNFSACYTHNYREFMGGFTDWVEQIADSKDALDYRKKVSRPGDRRRCGRASSFGANYKAAYCLASARPGKTSSARTSPTGKGFLRGGRPPVAGEGGDGLRRRRLGRRGACARRFPLKTIKRVGNGLRPRSIQRFLSGLPLTFQRGRRRG